MKFGSDAARPVGRFSSLVRRHRRIVASVMISLSLYCVIKAMQPAAPSVSLVTAAASDLPAGHTLLESDLVRQPWPTAVPHATAFSDPDLAVGRMTTGPLLAGEPIGPSRVVGPGLLEIARAQGNLGTASPAQLVTTAVRLADAGEVALLKPGDVVDVLAARATGISEESPSPAQAGEATVVARNVRVIVVPDAASGAESSLFGGQSRRSDGGLDSGSMVVFAVDEATATSLAGAATRSRLSVIIRPG